MDCRTDESWKFKRRLGFNLHDVIKTKEQSALQSIKDAFEREKFSISTQWIRV